MTMSKGRLLEKEELVNVYLVEELNHNLLSIVNYAMQIRVIFESSMCMIIDGKINKVLFYSNTKNNVYIIITCDLDN